jgi:post-segregation antitoxin (ccd killing protein)
MRVVDYNTRMNINVYLPDALGQQARKAKLPFSPLFQAAVRDELKRRAAIGEALQAKQTYTLELVDENGAEYDGRLTGVEVARGVNSDVRVYATDDKRVIVWDVENRRHYEVTGDIAEGLRMALPLDQDAYIVACDALGIRRVVEL